ncbi:MAG TPA: anti-sigma factor [Blastocatellia bacterium]|nr:anti-sigma factor [Blastocatellia bacterium]
MRHDEVNEESQEAAALYVLGALSQHEARAFERHLRDGCPACEIEVNQFEQVVGLIGSTAPPVSPPANLRERLINNIANEAKTSPQIIGQQADVLRFPEHPTLTRQIPSRPAPARAFIPWAIAASIFVAFIVSVFLWQSDRRALQAALDKSKEEAAQTSTTVAAAQPRVIKLAGQEGAPQASGEILWDVQTNRWIVNADLPPLPAGKVYQLWFVTQDAKISAGTMKASESGRVVAVVPGPSNNIKPVFAAITLEPEGGSPQPTSKIFVIGEAG